MSQFPYSRHDRSVIPQFTSAPIERARELMGHDYWRYGVKENAGEIEAMIRYSFEQGLSARKLTVEELFAKSTYELAKL